MQQKKSRLEKEIVLVGGGHCHVLFIKQWSMNPIPGVRLTLISAQPNTPYSGMLPGLVAGHYQYTDIHIDLVSLCFNCNVRFIQATVSGMDSKAKRFDCSDYPSINYDIASINIGSSPNTQGLDTNNDRVIAVKPIAEFLEKWQRVVKVLIDSKPARTLHVIGGGAGGVELICAIHRKLNSHNCNHQLTLLTRSNSILSNYPKKAQRIALNLLHDKGIKVVTNCDVSAIESTAIHTSKGEVIETDYSLVCSQASAANWPSVANLPTDTKGFIEVNKYLQVNFVDGLFAVGDISVQRQHPAPKAGVYAVRQAPTLWHNIRQLISKPKPQLKTYKPQHDFLSLISTGEKHGIAIKYGHAYAANWVWAVKHRIDQRFMRTFQNAPLTMGSTDSMQCHGCGAKVGSQQLHDTLNRFEPTKAQETNSNHSNPIQLGSDDAALIALNDIEFMVQSVDQINSLISDPFRLGQIATHHALSDLFAMSATPDSAQVLLTLAYAKNTPQRNDLYLTMQGIKSVLAEHQCQLIGGHTTLGSQTSIGLAVNGKVSSSTVTHKSKVQAGDKLIITQPLGTGIIFAAQMLQRSRWDWVESALLAMLHSNAKAAKILMQHGASACTDVTGFGLVGHLLEMLKPSGLSAQLDLNSIPLFSGAVELSDEGIRSSLYNENYQATANSLKVIANNSAKFDLLFDPQTSGGLMASIAAHKAEACLAQLKLHYPSSQCIGEIDRNGAEHTSITIR